MACGEDKWVAEVQEVRFSPEIECLEVEVEGESFTDCGGTEVVMRNKCAEDVVFVGWTFQCSGGTDCSVIPPATAGRAPLDVEFKEEETFIFDGSLGLETLQVVVSVTIDHQTPGCHMANGAVSAVPAAMLAGVVGVLALRRRLQRRAR
jgi:hypothetical protein